MGEHGNISGYERKMSRTSDELFAFRNSFPFVAVEGIASTESTNVSAASLSPFDVKFNSVCPAEELVADFLHCADKPPPIKFHTAGGRSISVSCEALKRARSLLGDLELECLVDETDVADPLFSFSKDKNLLMDSPKDRTLMLCFSTRRRRVSWKAPSILSKVESLPDDVRRMNPATAESFVFNDKSCSVALEWITNHYKWIVWKLASYERCYSAKFSGKLLTICNVLEELKYRYEREICYYPRSWLLKELFVGQKLRIWGAGLSGWTGPVSALEVSGTTSLLLHINGTYRAHWASRLGFCKGDGIPLSFMSIKDGGGAVPITLALRQSDLQKSLEKALQAAGLAERGGLHNSSDSALYLQTKGVTIKWLPLSPLAIEHFDCIQKLIKRAVVFVADGSTAMLDSNDESGTLMAISFTTVHVGSLFAPINSNLVGSTVMSK
ncbi:hypothetical protein HAX54_032516 [Datura stramonium]|uniref:Uncharacterized protein n=1 Tax=Datura stramonium TaxID=4076 RepID=A0ABS8VAU1_DATST|nr:hypothetical protein [Datura stramonium]